MHGSAPSIRDRLITARLPAMPQTLIKLIALCHTEDVGIPEMADLIAKDAGIAGKILSVANSSAYHRNGGKRVGLEQALAILGTDTIKTLIISESVFQVFNTFSQNDNTDLRTFWKHSLASAVMARAIADRMAYPYPEEAYLAGLLHDVGRLALLATAPQEYRDSFVSADDEGLCAKERDVLQITHPEAGAWIVERWQLDSFLADSVLYHHEAAPLLAEGHPLPRIVLLANLLATQGLAGTNIEAAQAICGLQADDLEAICSAAEDQVRQAADYLGIDLDHLPAMPPSAPGNPWLQRDPAEQILADGVRELVLNKKVTMDLVRQKGETALLETLARSARIVFGFTDAILLRSDPAGATLTGVPLGDRRQRLAEFSVPLRGENTLAQALGRRQPMFVDAAAAGIVDRQLLRLLATDCLVAVPLSAGRQPVGVLVGAIPAWRAPELRQRAPFLLAFASEAAGILAAKAAEQEESERQRADVSDQFREASRKVAHEVNNPLSIIKNYVSLLDSKASRQEAVGSEVAIINEEIDRVGQIVKRFAQLQPAIADGRMDINRVVRDTIRLFQGSGRAPANVTLSSSPHPDAPCAEGDGLLLRQILLNLIANAVEALPQGGAVRIEVTGQINRNGQLYTELTVSDDGPGIPATALAQLFAPQPSAKGGDHQGLGLSIVHGLIGELKGDITCRSSRHGTCFQILLPAAGPRSTSIAGQSLRGALA